MTRLAVVRGQIAAIERTRLERLHQAPADGPHAMVLLLAHVIGIGVETAKMLVQEILSRNLRDGRAVARYAGATGSPDESGSERREKGLARPGNARVRRGLTRLAWRFLMLPEGQWACPMVSGPNRGHQGGAQDDDDRGARSQTAHPTVALGHDREVPAGVVLRPAA
jgi:transposase